MTPEKREATIYFVAGLLWPGVIAVLVVTLLLIPDMKATLNSGKPYTGPSMLDATWILWIGTLVWPAIIAGLQKDQRGKPWTWYKRARWFFWLGFILAPITWPFLANT